MRTPVTARLPQLLVPVLHDDEAGRRRQAGPAHPLSSSQGVILEVAVDDARAVRLVERAGDVDVRVIQSGEDFDFALKARPRRLPFLDRH